MPVSSNASAELAGLEARVFLGGRGVALGGV
jgi:hypothetical protein